jgi:hypothetical protein
MLKKINEGGVESDAGFSIQITRPELLEYKTGAHKGEVIIRTLLITQTPLQIT